jgi:hypothetical protein
MAEVRFQQATKTYPGTDAAAVDALDLEVRDGRSRWGPTAWSTSAAPRWRCRPSSPRRPAVGERVSLQVRPDEAHLFDPAGGERLG